MQQLLRFAEVLLFRLRTLPTHSLIVLHFPGVLNVNVRRRISAARCQADRICVGAERRRRAARAMLRAGGCVSGPAVQCRGGQNQQQQLAAPRAAAGAAAHAPAAAPQPAVRGRARPPGRRGRLLVRSSADPDGLHEAKLGPNVAAGRKEVKEKLTWGPATVIRNEAVNLDGTHRLLHMSVSDDVDMLYGRKIQGVPDSTRWNESFTVPGQFVGVRLPQGESRGLAADQALLTIACSPYESRRDSAYIGGSIIEVIVDKSSGGQQAVLADLPPGAAVEVSQVVGRGFASLFNSYSGLPSSLEEQRNILALAVGLPGIAAIRAVLNWAPVQAHATSHKVTCYYVTTSPSSAAFLPEWDQWREAGIVFKPLYTESLRRGSAAAAAAPDSSSSSSNGNGSGSGGASASDEAAGGIDAAEILGLLEQGLFLHETGLEGALGGPASEATVLLAGMSGGIASSVARELTFKGVAWERLLFCDYF